MPARKPVVLRALADQDIQSAISWYKQEGGNALVATFIDQLEKAVSNLATHPEAGSSRYAHELDLPGLHHWPLVRFPYLIFYAESTNQIDVWRVLHAHRDIPASLQDAG